MIPANAKEVKFCGLCKHQEKGNFEQPCVDCMLRGFVEFRNKNKQAWYQHIKTKEHHPHFEKRGIKK